MSQNEDRTRESGGNRAYKPVCILFLKTKEYLTVGSTVITAIVLREANPCQWYDERLNLAFGLSRAISD